jgi:hypothetical protein
MVENFTYSNHTHPANCKKYSEILEKHVLSTEKYLARKGGIRETERK